MQSEPRYLEVCSLMKSDRCLNSEPNLHHHDLEVDKVNNLEPCVLDVDIENGERKILKFSDDCANLKSDDSLAVCLYIPAAYALVI